ncbi:MAG: PKD domain-containing protein [bacterium]
MGSLPACRRLVVSALALVFLVPAGALAHTPDQQPFVSIDGGDSKLYPVGSSSLSDIVLPQDLAPASYLVGHTVSFQLKPLNLPFPPELIPKLQIKWDFGDGASASTHDATHAYAKMGSYVIKLTSANPSEGVAPQVLDLIQINIVPRADYKLPVPVIKVEGKQSANPYSDILKFDFTKPLLFDGSASTAGSSPIVSYFWDFGDQNRGSGATTSHSYTTLWSYAAPSLRLTTRDGFFSDAMVQLENPNPTDPTASPIPAAAKYPVRQYWPYGLVGLAILAGGGVFLKTRPKNKKKPKRR